MTEETKDAVVDRYQRGQSMTFIAFALGTGPKQIREALVERGVKVRSGKPANKNWGWTGGMR